MLACSRGRLLMKQWHTVYDMKRMDRDYIIDGKAYPTLRKALRHAGVEQKHIDTFVKIAEHLSQASFHAAAEAPSRDWRNEPQHTAAARRLAQEMMEHNEEYRVIIDNLNQDSLVQI